METTSSELRIRRAAERGHANHGWLDSHHTFSFADYYDPAHLGFRSLRVINDDRVAPGKGFGTHPHRDMEIFSYVLEGVLEHGDSMGHRRQLKPGEVQLMSAGRGVTHSEYNPSADQVLHFLQIWIRPREAGLTPGYTEWRPTTRQESKPKVLVISPDGREGAATIQQDACIYRLRLDPDETATHELRPGRAAWLHVVRGAVTLNGLEFAAGDGVGTEQPGTLAFAAVEPTEALLFDLH